MIHHVSQVEGLRHLVQLVLLPLRRQRYLSRSLVFLVQL